MLKQVIIIWLSWQDNASEASNIFAKKPHREICQFFMYQMASQFCLNFRAKIYNFIFKQILPTKYVPMKVIKLNLPHYRINLLAEFQHLFNVIAPM